jgi:soluble lytic murein transglycosylase
LREAERGDGAARRLSKAAKAISAGDASTGLALLDRSAFDTSPLADYATYYRGVALQQLARLADADAALTALSEARVTGHLAQRVRLKLSEVALGRDDAERAEAILRSLADEKISAHDEILMTLARVEEGLAHRDHAIESYRQVYYGYPLSDQAGEARAGLDRLRAERAPLARELARAERLFSARRFADARAAFEPLAAAVSGDEKELVAIRLAACDVHLGRHRAARDRLRPLISGASRKAEARYYHLRAVRGLGDSSSYISLSRALVAEHRDTRWAAEALNDLASHYVIEDEDQAADRVFRQILDLFPTHQFAERASWRAGWLAYRTGQFAETVRLFESAAATFPRADYRPAWLYWSGRARDRLGDSREAAARYNLVVADYGSSYYGRLASRLLESRTGSAPVPVVATSQAIEVASPPPTASLMRALMAAGLYDDALAEVQFAQRAWGDSASLQATSAWIRQQQSRSLQGDERFAALRGAITTMRRAYPQFLSAAGEDLPSEILRVIFPLDYWDLIDRYARAHEIDPYLLAALMAQESTFTPEIRSSAGARGLMQVMPATGRLYARRLGIRPFTTASLSRPETNIRIGVQFFKDLLERFGGVHYALAGYNAGDSRVAEWLEENPGLPPDEFIDSIPFQETQNYVKRILGTAEDYRRLYGSGRLTPGLQSASAAAD